jgi:hypothetical protein
MEKNKIVGPLDATIPTVGINGVPILIVADLPEGGFLQIVSGDNPMVPATPSVQLGKGTMLAVVPVEVAQHMRPGLKELERRTALERGILGNGHGGRIVNLPLNREERPQ